MLLLHRETQVMMESQAAQACQDLKVNVDHLVTLGPKEAGDPMEHQERLEDKDQRETRYKST